MGIMVVVVILRLSITELVGEGVGVCWRRFCQVFVVAASFYDSARCDDVDSVFYDHLCDDVDNVFTTISVTMLTVFLRPSL